MLTSLLTVLPAESHALSWMPGPMEMVIILIVGLLIFGRRLPEIARNLGKGVVEFKKGIRGIEDEIRDENVSTPSAGDQPPPPPQPVAEPPSDAEVPSSPTTDRQS